MKRASAGALAGSHDSTFSFVSSPTPGGVQEVGSVRNALRSKWAGNWFGPNGVPGSPRSHTGVLNSTSVGAIATHRCMSWTESAGSPHNATLTPSTATVLFAWRERTLTAYS